MSELAVVFEEMGAALLCSPFFCDRRIGHSGHSASGDRAAMEEFLPTFVDGTSTATLILNGQLDAWDAAAVTLTAARDGDGLSDIRATRRWCSTATLRTSCSWRPVPAAGTPCSRSPRIPTGSSASHSPAWTALARWRACGSTARPAELIGTDGDAATGLARTSDLAVVALAAEQVGAAQRCLDMAVDYAKNRIQFGRAIGSFQAIKHRCADMLVSGRRGALGRRARRRGGRRP